MLTPPKPLRVAVLSSHRAPGLARLLHDASHGPLYQIVGLASSEAEFADLAILREAAVPFVSNPIRAFHRASGRPLSDVAVRAEYDAHTAAALHAWGAEVVLCCSYLYLLTPRLLDAFPNAVLSVHHSDMLDRTDNGVVRYPGLRAVRDAIMAGAFETRSTLHVVTPALDDGPTIVRSWAFAVSPLVGAMRACGAADALKAYAFAHQEWMLRCAWGPLMVHALELAALDRNGLAAGQLLGAPWELTVHGQLRATCETALAVAVHDHRGTWR